MPIPIIAGLARIAAAAARAAPSISRSAAGAARSSPVGTRVAGGPRKIRVGGGLRQSFRDVSHAAMRVAPTLDTIATFTSRVDKAADALGGFIGPVVKAGVALVTLPDKIARFGDSVISAQRHLATYNGAMGLAQMRLEGQRYRRDLQMSVRTQGTFGSLTESQSRLEQTLLPFKAGIQNATNMVATVANTLADVHVRAASAFAAGFAPNLAASLALLAGPTVGTSTSIAADMMNRIARGDYSKRRMPVLDDPSPPPPGRRGRP